MDFISFPSSIKNFFIDRLNVIKYQSDGKILYVNDYFKKEILRKFDILNFYNFYSFFSLVKEINTDQNTDNQSGIDIVSECLMQFRYKENILYFDSLIYYNKIENYYLFLGSDITEFIKGSPENEAFYKFITETLQIDLSYSTLEKKFEIIMKRFEELFSISVYGIYVLNVDDLTLNLLVRKNLPEELEKNYSIIVLSEKIEVEDVIELEDSILIKRRLPELYDFLNSLDVEFIPLVYQNEFLGIFIFKSNKGKQKNFAYFINSFILTITNIIYKKILFDNINYEFKKINETNDKLINVLEENLILQNIIYRYTPKKTFSKVKDSIRQSFLIPNERNYYFFLFLDIVDFTKFSENKDPEFVIQSLNSYFSHLVDIIYDNNGDIDKFMGDNIFAFFESADDALKASLEMIHYFKNHTPKEFAPFKCKISLHCGEAIHGNLGNKYRSEFTLIGDSVNTTSRLQKVCKNNQIVVSEEFVSHLSKKNVPLSKKYYLKVKGKSNQIPIYFILDEFARHPFI